MAHEMGHFLVAKGKRSLPVFPTSYLCRYRCLGLWGCYPDDSPTRNRKALLLLGRLVRWRAWLSPYQC